MDLRELDALPTLCFSETTVLFRAVSTGARQTVRFLVERGCCDADRASGAISVRPLMAACYVKNAKERIAIVNILLDSGADPSLTDVKGRSSLTYACALKQADTVGAMLRHWDFDLNQQDCCGNTALHVCASCGDPHVLKLLLRKMVRYGLDISVRNSSGLTPLAVALAHGHRESVGILHTSGATPRRSKEDFIRLLDSKGADKKAGAAQSVLIEDDHDCQYEANPLAIADHRLPPSTPAISSYSSESDPALIEPPLSNDPLHQTRSDSLTLPKIQGKCAPGQYDGGCSPVSAVHSSARESSCLNRILSVYPTRTSSLYRLPSRELSRLDAVWMENVNTYARPPTPPPALSKRSFLTRGSVSPAVLRTRSQQSVHTTNEHTPQQAVARTSILLQRSVSPAMHQTHSQKSGTNQLTPQHALSRSSPGLYRTRSQRSTNQLSPQHALSRSVSPVHHTHNQKSL